MATLSVNLDTTQYVQVNIGHRSMILQAHRDEVRIVLADSKPSRGNNVFHLLSGTNAPLHLDVVDTNVWALALTDSSSLIVTEATRPYEVTTGPTHSYQTDAWGRPKSVEDCSLFAATWTFDIPNRVWVEESVVRDVQQQTVTVTEQASTGTKVTSREGMLSVKSGTVLNNGNAVRSKVFPRYQPNRGHLYSTAVTCPVATANGYRQWGLATADNGAYFRMIGDGNNWTLNAGRRRDGVEVELTDITSKLPAGFDPAKGHVYDIQYQWRGVGNFLFYVDLKLVYVMELLGTQDYLSVTDPALGVVFSCYTSEEGTELELLSGCVDVTSEGGGDERTLFGSIDSGDDFIQTTARQVGSRYIGAVLALRVPKTITYNGDTVFYSRGAIMDQLNAWANKQMWLQSYVHREDLSTNLRDNVTWVNVPDSNLQYAVGGHNSLLESNYVTDEANGVKAVSRAGGTLTNADIEIVNKSKNSDFRLTPGDMIVVVSNMDASQESIFASLAYSEEL